MLPIAKSADLLGDDLALAVNKLLKDQDIWNMITRKRFNLNKSSQKIVKTSSYLVVARVGKKFFWIFDPGNSRPAPDRNTSQNEVPTKKRRLTATRLLEPNLEVNFE